ncbi:isoprenoid synthase domain-containing protein [Neurospora intermedia]|uniref:Terpene synthase n=1 Tax=Neurospora intermedia TaxID=5142 RepID=A0ABR3DA78_NEUIN
MAPATSERPTTAQVYANLHGLKLHFPSLQSILSSFPTELSPQYGRLCEIVEKNIDDRIEEPDIRAKAKKINIALLCAYWWPRSSLERLVTMSWFVFWIFVWDDEAEESSTQDLDLDSKTTLSERALRYVAFHLGLDPPSPPPSGNIACVLPSSPPTSRRHHHQPNDSDPDSLFVSSLSSKEPPPPTKYSVLFKPAAEGFKQGCTLTERTRLYSEIQLYLHSSALEVATYAGGNGTVPTEKEYWVYRRGTNGIGFFSCLGEFMTEITIPQYLFQTEEMKTLWEELAKNVVIVNDVLSLPKEMKVNWPGLVAIDLTYRTSCHNLDKAINLLVEDLRQVSTKMEAAGARLREMVAQDPDPMVKKHVEKYLHSVYTIMTGHYEWTLATERYGLAKRGWLKSDKSVAIPL